MKKQHLRPKPKGKVAIRRWLEELVVFVAREQARLQPLFPHIDPHDLNLILSRMARPLEDRRYFVHKIGDAYVR